ncbi:MAG TPA: response regulator [Tepidisphaeraceae bacterium]|jgi:DNA-binding response OmpR family regulator
MENGNVLVVEDDLEINQLVGAYAEIAGFDYRSALDGATALRQARERQPSLIVLDLMLPDIDGFAVCKQLKSEERTRKVPILMLTALDRDEHRRKGMECGAAAYITKPFDPDHLMQTIIDTATPSH